MSRPPILDPLAAYALWAPAYPAHAHNPVMRAEERAMLALMPSRLDGLAVLDAGCGSGRYMSHALRRGATHVIGIDLSPPMLRRAARELRAAGGCPVPLAQAQLTALPLAGACADLTVCGLVLGHLEALGPALAELRRVTRPGGTILCSDVHPIGTALGWQRDFRADGQRYAVRHTQHLYSHWHAACAALALAIEEVREPMLDPATIPAGAQFDRTALEVPVALVLRLRRLP
ncbi:class I SAM-dependent methyltransferase [Fulvimonas yonginensis]|uniref:Class I SAM-dependent methyltransferase n=1 Tax=Fulvimonas yonginensis TaxID=1495200 RepID=A0ABU8JAX5_9GAMM